jgi:hypothetical protein
LSITKDGDDVKDVEEFMPVYQDSTDPAREFRSILKEVGFSIRTCEVTYIYMSLRKRKRSLKGSYHYFFAVFYTLHTYHKSTTFRPRWTLHVRYM